MILPIISFCILVLVKNIYYAHEVERQAFNQSVNEQKLVQTKLKLAIQCLPQYDNEYRKYFLLGTSENLTFF